MRIIILSERSESKDLSFKLKYLWDLEAPEQTAEPVKISSALTSCIHATYNFP